MQVPPWVIAFIIFLIVYILVRELLRRYYNAKFEGFFNTAHYEEALGALNALPARVTMTTYQQYRRRFLCYEAMDDAEMAKRMIELLVRMRNSAKRQSEILPVAFNYFVQINNKERAKELLAQIKAVKGINKSIVSDCQLTYDIVYSKSYQYIDKMEEMLKMSSSPTKQGKLCFLLWKQYSNKGDKTHAKAYKRRFEELTKTTKPQKAD